jgi:hypothetical protein
MNETPNSARKVRAWAYLSPHLKELLARRARDEHDSESEVITKALTMYLTKDVTDESFLLAKMSELARTVANLDRKIEVGQKLGLEYLQYFFMTVSEFPSDKKELGSLQTRAAQRTAELVTLFRRREKRMPRFLETVLGAMLEEELEEKGQAE